MNVRTETMARREFFNSNYLGAVGLILLLLAAPEPANSDVFATLFVVLSMQAVPRLGMKVSVLCIGPA